jgi:four helix bundle protein
VAERAQRFEDLIAWQKARLLTKEIYLATRRGSFRGDFGLARQIQRAAVSVMSNLAEVF